MKQNRKPFDLEAALNGAAVVTREGKEVTEVVVLKTMIYARNVLAIIDGELYWFHQDGKVAEDVEYNIDLFMKPQQVTKWVNIYVTDTGTITTGKMFDTQQQAMNEHTYFGEPFSTTQITFEV